MLKQIFGQISKLMKPAQTDWEKFSQKLYNPEKYLSPRFVAKFEEFSDHPVYSHELKSYKANSHGLCVGLLHVTKDSVSLHTKDETGKYSCWKWASSVDGVIPINARNGVSVGPKSADLVMNDISATCFREYLKTVHAGSAEYMAVQKARSAYNRTMPISQMRDPELKFGMPS